MLGTYFGSHIYLPSKVSVPLSRMLGLILFRAVCWLSRSFVRIFAPPIRLGAVITASFHLLGMLYIRSCDLPGQLVHF